MLTFGSLFAGIGGFDLGFERSGMVCKWQVEIDDYATKVLEKHWPNVHRERDIKECGKHNLEYVDVICGGFPCQGISQAGKKKGLSDERSGLWSEFNRIIRDMVPRIVVVENSSNITSRGLGTILGDMAELGFNAEWSVFPACTLGAPHTRKRMFIVAYRDCDGLNRTGIPQKPRSSLFSSTGSDRSQRGETLPKSKHWETEPRILRVVDGVPSRVDRIKCLGNAVVPQIPELIGRKLMECFCP